MVYYAVQNIALGDAMALVFTAPLFTLFFEWIFIRRPEGMFIKLAFAILLIVGVVLVVQPPWLMLRIVQQPDYTVL